MKWLFFAGAATVFLIGATPAAACRMYREPSQRVSGDFDAIALGVVTRAEPRPGAERPGWTATVRVSRSIEGRTDATSYEIGRTGSSAACDDGQAIGKPGEVWVLYLSRHPQLGRMSVAHSYPLNVARLIDPRFRP
jgi:hypothetical protein